MVLLGRAPAAEQTATRDTPMNHLETFYRSAIKVWAAVSAIIMFAAADRLADIIPKEIIPFDLGRWAKQLTSLGVLGGAFLVGEAIIRTSAWRWFWFNKKLDLAGDWIGATIYTQIEQETSAVPSSKFQRFSRIHDVHIEQDCLGVRISPSKGVSFARWGSIAASLDCRGDLEFVYRVNYDGSPLFPGFAFGYEHLAPTMHEKGNRKGRPVLLTGEFGHCAGFQKPIYSGLTVFVRKGFEHLVKFNELPLYARECKELEERLSVERRFLFTSLWQSLKKFFRWLWQSLKKLFKGK